MFKKLSKILWNDSRVDNDGKPLLPPIAKDAEGLTGLLPGELFLHRSNGRVSLWSLSADNKIVEISGDVTEQLSRYLLKSVWDSAFEIKIDGSGQKYIFGKLPVVTQYGVTMYSDNEGLDVPSIYDGLPIDGVTLYWEEVTDEEGNITKVLKSKGGGNGTVSNMSITGEGNAVTSVSLNKESGYLIFDKGLTFAEKKFLEDNYRNNDYLTEHYYTKTYIDDGFIKKDKAKELFVTLDETAQNIDGVKNFLNGVKINGLPITKLSGYDDVIYIDANVVVRGGLSMYYDNGEIDLPSIIDEIGIAGYDGKKLGLVSLNSEHFSIGSDGTVSIIGGTGGGITNITSEMIVDALGYTPYSAANPNGYITSSALEKYLPLSGGTITGDLRLKGSGNYGNTLRFGDNDYVYLKEATDDVLTIYASSGINLNTSSSSVKVDGIPLKKSADDVLFIDANVVVRGGLSTYGTDGTTFGSIWDNAPLATTYSNNKGVASFDPAYFSVTNGYVSFIGQTGGGGGIESITKQMVIDALGYTPYNSTNPNGYITSSGSISGNAATATQVYVSKSESTAVGPFPFVYINSTTTGSGNTKLYFHKASIGVDPSTNSIVATNFKGNATTATTASKLSTVSKTAWGQTYWTSGGVPTSISGDMTGVGNITMSGNLYANSGDVVANSFAIIRDGKNVGGRISYRTDSSSLYHMEISNSSGNGNIYFRTISNSVQDDRMILYHNGNLLVKNGFTQYSDIRKKTKLADVELTLKQIADAPLIEHYYNSDKNKTTHVSSVAQYWAGMNDWFCKLDEEGYYTMELQNAALASAISVARHLQRYETKTDKTIRQLKKRISQLEDEIELLKKGEQYGSN